VVLAIKRPVREKNGFKEVVYTPYSEGIDIPILRETGLNYLKDNLNKAKDELHSKGVRPRFSEQFVSEDISTVLAIIEHIDPLRFTNGKYDIERLIHETLVIMGANKNNAYRYSVSHAGARGLFQFIPSTYKRVINLYPNAGLKREFIHGMEDHVNAAKATLLLFDADLGVLKNGQNEFFLNDSFMTGIYLAASYNCGAGKTKAVIKRYGEKWTTSLPLETQIYLKKFKAVWQWLNVKG